MKLPLKANHLRRYKEIAQLLMKYGRSDAVREFGLEEALTPEELASCGNGVIEPEQLADDLERMGPTYVKLGQILSSRPDLLPERYIKALSRLQDKVKPFPYSDVERIVQQELGARISKAFSEFDPKPMAAASLGQVHRARLRNGRPVVVKVQRPDIRQQIAEDLEVIEEISGFLDRHTDAGKRYQATRIFEEFQRTLLQELDYQREASNLVTFARNLDEFPRIQIPLPVEDYTTRSVLTMDYIRGRKITRLSPIARLDINGAPLAEELFRAYLKMVLVDGIFHADPHPGNVFLTDDGRVALIDLGMVGRTLPGMQEKLIRLLIAVSEGRGDEAAEIAINMSQTRSSFDEAGFRRRIGVIVAEQQDHTLKQIDVGKTLLAIGRTAGQSGLYVPMELTLLGKTLLQLDEVGRHLDPGFNPNAAIRRNVREMMHQRLIRDLTPGNLMASLLELKDFLSRLPTRFGRVLDAVAGAELEIKVKSTEVNEIVHSFQQIANRITTGLILAALIVGASLLMQVDTEFQLFGYPGLAMVMFMIAAGLGLGLVLMILLRDHRDKNRDYL